MKKIYSLMFIITLMLTLGIVSNVKAVNLSYQDGQIILYKNIAGAWNPISNMFAYTVEQDENNPELLDIPDEVRRFEIAFNRVGQVNCPNQIQLQSTAIDLTGIDFPKLGDYRLYVTEEASQNSAAYPVDNAKKYTIVVSVRNVLDAGNHPTGQLEATLAHISLEECTGESSCETSKVENIEFDTVVQNEPIAISAEVEGNMANADEYFKVLLDIDCPTGDVFTVSYSNVLDPTATIERAISYNGSTVNRLPATGNATYTCSNDPQYVYLKHGERAEISEVLMNDIYSFVEQDATNYSTYINDSSDDSKISEERHVLPVPQESSYVSDSNENRVLNVQTSQVPTGVILKYLPYIVLMFVVIGALVFFVVAKKKTKENIN